MRAASALLTILIVTPALANQTMTSAPFGKLSVVTQIDDSSDHPVPDMPTVLKEIRLEWRSADHRVRFFLKDDGRTLSDSFDVYKPGTTDVACGRYGGKLRSYQSLEVGSKAWLALKPGFVAGLNSICPKTLTEQERQAYTVEFSAAAADLGPAVEAMKAAAQQQFGGWQRRCLWFGGRSRQPYPPCTRYSAK